MRGRNKRKVACTLYISNNIFKSRATTGGNLLFSEQADFTFEVFILEFGVIVTAKVGIIERVVVQIWK